MYMCPGLNLLDWIAAPTKPQQRVVCPHIQCGQGKFYKVPFLDEAGQWLLREGESVFSSYKFPHRSSNPKHIPFLIRDWSSTWLLTYLKPQPRMRRGVWVQGWHGFFTQHWLLCALYPACPSPCGLLWNRQVGLWFLSYFQMPASDYI